jgi:lipopolysaccharide export LptBFGC system permease protein LptF
VTVSAGGRDQGLGAADARVEAERAANRRERLAAILQRSGAFVVLVIVACLAAVVFGGRFASVDNFLNILEASSFLGLVAFSYTHQTLPTILRV